MLHKFFNNGRLRNQFYNMVTERRGKRIGEAMFTYTRLAHNHPLTGRRDMRYKQHAAIEKLCKKLGWAHSNVCTPINEIDLEKLDIQYDAKLWGKLMTSVV